MSKKARRCECCGYVGPILEIVCPNGYGHGFHRVCLRCAPKFKN